jgi:putative ABC transport system permease protein
MNLLKLTWKNLRYRKYSSLLTVFAVSIGSALIIVMLQVRGQTENYFSGDSYGYDLIMGAKGSSLQLVLNTMYHLDKPIENIPLALMEQVEKHPQVDWVIPFSLGDNFRGYRLVGTNNGFFKPSRILKDAGALVFDKGGPLAEKFDCVLGAQAARSTGLTIGDKIYAAHGLEQRIEKKEHHHEEDEEIEEVIGEDEFEDEHHEEDAHDTHPYKVAGILKPTGTPLDRIILVDYLSVLTLHDLDDSERREITSMAVKMISPTLAFGFRQAVNKGKVAQAVLPYMEMEKLMRTVGRLSGVLLIMSYIVLFLGCLAIFLSIYNSLRERRRSLFILRAIGAGRKYLFLNLFLEGLAISLTGGILGYLGGHLLLLVLRGPIHVLAGMDISPFSFFPEEILALGSIALIGVLVSLLPGFWAYKTDVGQGLTME